jgi:hypothetical protein
MKIIITEEQHRLIKESKGKLAKISLKSLPGDSNEERYLNFMKLYEKAKEARGFTGIHIIDDLNLSTAFIKSLGEIKKIDGDLYLRFSFVEDLGDLEYVGGNVYLKGSDHLKSLGNLREVGGELSIEDCVELEDLGQLEIVKTIKGLETTKVTSLGNLKEIGYLWVGNEGDIAENLESLGELRKVEKYLDLSKSKIKTLGNLEYVGDWFSLIDSQIEDLGNLKFVGSTMSILRTPLLDKYDPNEIEEMVDIRGTLYYD